ncbi:hypothetical protein OG225_18505 [Nocardia sp. NBC_01377]|uniref:hypothetical protein n=1 Tax=Nocardia sp. NBC_01377 TaxID=2903595 RepID=UPI00324B5462
MTWSTAEIQHQRSRLRAILERATGVSATEHDVYATVKFVHGVTTTQRVSMWWAGDTVRLGAWVGELKPQYTAFYPNPTVVDGLLALEYRGWSIGANLHLAYHTSRPEQRWYPAMALTGRDYIGRWTRDLPHAGRRPREEIADPRFGRWLVDRSYLTDRELPGLRDWLDRHSRRHIDIRPSVAVEKEWATDETSTGDRTFAARVRAAIDELLDALDEPGLRATP